VTRVSAAARMGSAGVIAAIVLATSSGCDSCSPVTLTTKDLKPTRFSTGTSGTVGADGFCLVNGTSPSSAFSAGTDHVMVGFDNFFRAGSGFLPCDDIRANVFRGGVVFDVSPFDVLASATLSFDTARSILRTNGATIGAIPGTSFATTVGVGIQPPFPTTMPETNVESLPAGPRISVIVSDQVGDWIDKTVPNFGFIIGGPTGLVDRSDLPKNNEAKLSWYQNFNLQVLYNPALNPRAPK
jgi:hypothetical protein